MLTIKTINALLHRGLRLSAVPIRLTWQDEANRT